MRNGWRTVGLLAATSLIADVSGEMVMAVLPFLLVEQGATGLGIGLVAGVTEGLGHVMKLVGGRVGQSMRKPLLLVGAGYLAAAVSRIGVALAGTWALTMAFRSLDRVGKGLRTAPRDAILADAVTPSTQARAFGLHRTADTAGAVIGTVAAMLMLSRGALESDIVLVGAGIGLLAVVPLAFVRSEATPPPAPRGGRESSRPYLVFLGVSSLFALGRVSYLFYVLRATMAGASTTEAVGLYLLFNVVYAAASYPFGALADKWGRRRILIVGYTATALSAIPFLLGADGILLWTGFTVFGLSYAAIEGNQRALAADLAGARTRSAKLGEYHAAVGFATLLGGIVAGLLWDQADPSYAFAWCILVSVLALLGLFAMLRYRIAERAPQGPDVDAPT